MGEKKRKCVPSRLLEQTPSTVGDLLTRAVVDIVARLLGKHVEGCCRREPLSARLGSQGGRSSVEGSIGSWELTLVTVVLFSSSTACLAGSADAADALTRVLAALAAQLVGDGVHDD